MFLKNIDLIPFLNGNLRYQAIRKHF